MRNMERFFNIAGPCVAAKHYMLPAAERLPEVVGMIRRELYFVIHAPRQSGKTTALKQLVRDINGAGERVAMYCSLEALQNVMKVETAIPMVISLICEDVPFPASLALVGLRNIKDYKMRIRVVVERNGVLDFSCPIVKELVEKYVR